MPQAMKSHFRPHVLLAGIMLVFVLVGCLQAQTHGIDVSKFQGEIDWAKVSKSKKVKFVYVRATEGTTIRDAYYKANVDSARKHKVLVGSYHVYSSKTTAYQQFANFKAVVSKKKQDLIPVLDIEGHHSGRLDMARVNKLLELMEREYGVKPMIYTSEQVYQEHFQGKRYRAYHIFIANYRGTPAVRYTLWQHSNKGRIPGIAGDVDLNRFHKKRGLNDIRMPKKVSKKESATKNKKPDTAQQTVDTAKQVG